MKQLKKSAIIIGRQPIIEALNSEKHIDRIFLLRTATGDIVHQIKQLANSRNIPVNLVPAEKLDSLTRGNHQGCVGLVGLVQYLDLQDVISHVVEKGQTPLFLILDGITDVRNIGAIARSAVCCGAQAIIIADKGVAPLNEDAMKASAGALEKVQICRVPYLNKVLDTLHLNGIQVFASDMNMGKPLFECNLVDPVAFIIGSEDKGILSGLKNSADGLFHIPMSKDFDSFNVSVAAGIILYESFKQRMLQGSL